jgi:hypothetical protein
MYVLVEEKALKLLWKISYRDIPLYWYVYLHLHRYWTLHVVHVAKSGFN